MTINKQVFDILQFKQTFMLHRLINRDRISVDPANKVAAVLIPLIWSDKGFQLLLTQRAAHLNVHAGQISFPGGKKEQTDKNLIETALRESNEEIGLKRPQVDIIGTLPAYNTVTGFKITSVIGLVQQDFMPTIDANEVESCFTVPWDFLMQPNNRYSQRYFRRGKYHKVNIIPYQDRFIWGATAAIIDELCQHMQSS